ncbi:MAG TPA: DUF6798 domain-containing protein [Acidobacteriota bacterium]
MKRPQRGLTYKQFLLLLLIAAGAVLVHGYHPAAEDAEIYLPGIKKALNPSLYPVGSEFFLSHAKMTLFPDLIAWSVRLSHVPLDYALLLWHLLSILLLMLACWRLSRQCFSCPQAHWGGVLMVAALLTIPVAGTSLYIMDQYLDNRSLSTPAIMFAIGYTLERKFVRATLWILFGIMVHPLMAAFGVFYLVCLLGAGRYWQPVIPALVAPFLGILPPVSDAYRDALSTHSYFFILDWTWYEWVGVFCPLVLLWCFVLIGRNHALLVLALACRALAIFVVFFLSAALVVTVPAPFVGLAELQPMRGLHLLYLLLFLFAGGIAGQFVLRKILWRWLLLFVPLCIGMCYVQYRLFPASFHVEWPDVPPENPWLQAFNWIRLNTPQDSLFALDPNHMDIPGEDEQGFRALAERSMLADNVKDSGAVSMFPALAQEWRKEVRALDGWQNFQLQDFRRLKKTFGVSWVVLRRPGAAGLICPYQNNLLVVCRVD